MIRLRAGDAHELDAYVARPAARTRGGIVIAQEMYGVNDYLRSVCDFFATQGYVAIAPALYDRKQRGLTFAYTKDDHDRAQKTYITWNFDHALADLDAAHAAIADAGTIGKTGKIGILGFCWGGTLAWLAACRHDYACAVAYYGSMMPDFAGETARCPVAAHVGDRDTSFPLARIAQFRAAQPAVQFHVYEGAQHGFDNPNRAERYHPAAHALARERTLEFLAQHLA
jgi:carboxymethylenebutenolidase